MFSSFLFVNLIKSIINVTVMFFDSNVSPNKFSLLFYSLLHYRRTGALRPTTGPSYLGNNSNKRPRSKTGQLYFYHGYHDGASTKHKRKPPKGMYINHDDVVVLATQSKLEQSPNNISQFISNQKTSLASPSTSAAAASSSSGGGSNVTENNPNRVDDLLASMDREIVSLWSHVRITSH